MVKARASLNIRSFRYTNARYQLAPQMVPARLPRVYSIFCGEDQKLISAERGNIPSAPSRMNSFAWGGRTPQFRSIDSGDSSMLGSLQHPGSGWLIGPLPVVRAAAVRVLLLFAMVDEMR